MQRTSRQPQSRLTLLAVVWIATVAVACQDGDYRPTASTPGPTAAAERAIMMRSEARMAEAPMKKEGDGRAAPEYRSSRTTALPDFAASAPRDSISTQSAPIIPDMIIRNGSASIKVDSLELAIANVNELVARLNGYVGNVAVTSGENEVRSATLELKVPAARFNDAMAGMQPIGKVESSMSTAADVGEEFVDVSARMANGKRLEDRLVSLLAARTGTLEDVLSVERELARVRQEIERYEGRIRFLKSRVATSTITVNVHEAVPLVSGVPGTNVIGEAVADMWRNFVHFIAASISALGYLIPLALICAATWLLLRRYAWWMKPVAK